MKRKAVGHAEFVDGFLYAGEFVVAGSQQREIVNHVVAAALVRVVPIDKDKIDRTDMGRNLLGCTADEKVAVAESREAAKNIKIEVIKNLLRKIHGIVVIRDVQIGVDTDEAMDGCVFEQVLRMTTEGNADFNPYLQRHAADDLREMRIAATPRVFMVVVEVANRDCGVHR